jgi:AAA family ATP:ADP antiporter
MRIAAPLQRVSRPRLVDLRAGEGAVFVRAFVVLLLTIAGHTLLETARDALFLGRLGPGKLAYVYVAAAVGALALTPLTTNLVKLAGARNALVLSLLVTAFGAAWFRVRPPSASLVFALYVFGTLSATVLVAGFWQLASGLFSASQGRRLFGLLAAGGVSGAMLGAAIATQVLRFAGVRSLLSVAALAYFAASLVATLMEATPPLPQRPAVEPQPSRPREMFRERFVLRLAVMAAIGSMTSVVIDYVFKAGVAARLSPAELAPFFARYQLLVNAGLLILQVGITARLVERLGVLGLVLLPPVLLTWGGVAAVLSRGAFGAVVALKAADAALRNSIGRVGTELLWAPVEDQTRSRGAVDVIATRGAQAVAGFALLLVLARWQASPTQLAVVGTCLSALWLAVGIGIRPRYVELFRRALGRGSLERNLTLPELDLNAVETLVEALARPTVEEVLAALNVLAERNRTRLIPALILYRTEPVVLVRALELFGESGRRDWVTIGEKLLDHADPDVQRAAVRAFALIGEDAVLERATSHASAQVRAFALVYLAERAGEFSSGDPLTWELFSGDAEHGHLLKRAFIEALGLQPTAETMRILLELGRVPELASDVTRALGHAADPMAIPFLLERLAVAQDRAVARAALVRLAAPAQGAVTKAAFDPDVSRRVRIHLPVTLAAFKNTRAVQTLVELLRDSNEGFVRYKALRGLEQVALATSLAVPVAPIAAEIVRNGKEYLRLFALLHALAHPAVPTTSTELVVVRELLDDKLEQSLGRVARLLQVAHRTDDLKTVFAALRSSDRVRRARAVEFLDALVRSFGRASIEAAAVLRLVVDELSPDERVRRATALVETPHDARAGLQLLAEDADQLVSDLARNARHALGWSQESVPPIARLPAEVTA